MSWELTEVRFARHEDGCCELCNPIAMTDYETDCVRVQRVGRSDLYICANCVRGMSRALRPALKGKKS